MSHWRAAAKMLLLLIVAAAIFSPGLVRAGNSDSISLSFTPKDTWPPIAITNLSALAGSGEGDVQLTWTAPYEDDAFPNSRAVSGYYVEYDTFSIDSLGGDTTAWWNIAAGWKQITFANDPGATETTDFDSLWPGSTYYFAIKSYDDASPPNESPIDTRAASVTDQAYCVVPDTPPATPTGLTAIAGVEKVDLSWTELTESEKGIDFDYYRIYRSSISPSVLFAIDTTTSTVYSDTGLQYDTTYYYAVSAVDQPPLVLESPLSQIVTAWVVLGDTTAPAAITDLQAVPGDWTGEADLVWTEPGDDGVEGTIIGGRYGVKYSTDPAFAWNGPDKFEYEWSPAQIVPGNQGKLTRGGLEPGTTYYFRIWTRDDAGNWSPISNGATTWAQIVVLSPPTGLVAKAGNRQVTLTWTPNPEEDISGYLVYRSTTSGSYNYGVALATVTHPTTRYVDTGLINDTTYYYVLRAMDTLGLASEASYEVWARPSLRPRPPCGVRGALVDSSKHMKVQWRGVTRNEDGSPCTDLEGYRVYKSTYLEGFVSEPTAVVTSSVLSWNEMDDISQNTYYYDVRAVDIGGVESVDSMIIMVEDEKVNIIAPSEDMEAKVLIPEELTDILYKETNYYEDDLNITVTEEIEEENKDRVVSCYEFSAWKGYENETLNQIENFSFDKPKASVSLYYEVNREGLVKGTTIKASQAESSLALFWFNGIEWVKVGAKTDTVEQALTIRTKKLGKYKIKESFAATEFSLNKVYPRTFTPNNDGLNDVVNFEYANPNNKGVVCRIFDLRGALVRQLDIGQTETSFSWDGRDQKGKVVPSGVYIYQLEAEGKVINGTVILAK